MMNVYSWIRQYFVFGDADVLKRKRAANQAPDKRPVEAPLEPPTKAQKTSDGSSAFAPNGSF
jgi:hypothetical protein